MRRLEKQDIYNEYVHWYVLPKDEKEEMGITSEVAFSNVFNVSRKQLWVWKNRPDFRLDVNNAIRNMIPEHQIQLYHTVLERAKTNAKFPRLWLKLFSNGIVLSKTH